MSLRLSPLQSEHEALGARFTDFGGFSMPLSYEKGTLHEHMACRSGAVVFDVSHLGTVHVEGEGSFERLQQALSNDLGKISPGQAQYSHLLNDEGGVLDDVIVWWHGAERFDVMPNASNTSRVLEAVGGRDVTDERCLLAVQGPKARQVVAQLSEQAAGVRRFQVAPFAFGTCAATVAGTGYTGEDGVEISIPLEEAVTAWRSLLGAGAEPAGLGARDTLRLEAGLPLHGHELDPSINPLEAGLSFVVGWKKESFTGKDALVAIRERGGPSRLLSGLLGGTRRPLREGSDVLSGGEVISTLTSGNFSPVLGRGIGLCFLPTGVTEDHLEVELRGRRVSVRRAKPPFNLLELDRDEA